MIGLIGFVGAIVILLVGVGLGWLIGEWLER
jgi:hypothetical protein